MNSFAPILIDKMATKCKYISPFRGTVYNVDLFLLIEIIKGKTI